MGVQKIDLSFELCDALLEIVDSEYSLAVVSGYIGVCPIGYAEDEVYGFIGDDGVFYAYGYEERYV